LESPDDPTAGADAPNTVHGLLAGHAEEADAVVNDHE
jgi:hypothetical protein